MSTRARTATTMVAARVAFGQEEEQRREEQRDERDADRRERPGRGGLGAGLEVHHRPRQAAGDREAAREGRADVRSAERDQLLVGVDALPALGREGEGDRDRLHVADDRDQERGHEELRPERQVERRQGEAGQALGHLADDLDALLVQPDAPDGEGGHDEGHGGADLRDRARGLLAEAGPEQQGLEAAARPEEERQRPEADGGRGGVDVDEVGHQGLDDLDEGLALRVDAEDRCRAGRPRSGGPRP